MNLYFLSSNGEKRLVASNINAEDNVYTLIENYVKELNPDFKIYYIRSWGNVDKDGITYDVGSHSEFFLLINEENK